MMPYSKGLVLFFVSLLLVIVIHRGVDCQECEDGDIRYDPDYLEQNVIQVCLDESWGYVCGQSPLFTSADASVVCNQFGNKSDETSVVVSEFASALPGDLSLRSVYCTGLENRFIDCPIYNTYGTPGNCKKSGKFYYAGVLCSDDELECINGEIRHSEDLTVQICVNGQFELLCADSGGWNNNDGETACRELGENPEGAITSYRTAQGDEDPYPIRFHCVGDESTLAECPKQLLQNGKCDDDTVAILTCQNRGDPVEVPLIIGIEYIEPQLSISWAITDPDDYAFYTTCTNFNASTQQNITFEALSYSDTVTFIGIPVNNQYSCCVVAYDEDGRASEPRCKEIFISSLDKVSPATSFAMCLGSASRNSVKSVSASNSNTVRSSSNSAELLDGYGPWVFGFIIGVVVGVFTMAIICGCCLGLCIRKERKQMKRNYLSSSAMNTISVNHAATSHAIDPVSNNPLYHSNNVSLQPTNNFTTDNSLHYDQKEKSFEEYTYISERPLPAPPTTTGETNSSYNTIRTTANDYHINKD